MSNFRWTVMGAAISLAGSCSALAQQSPVTSTAVEQSPLSKLRSGREAGNNDQILTTGIRTVQPDANYAPPLPANHALIITVSEYQRSPLPGVLTDRKLGIERYDYDNGDLKFRDRISEDTTYRVTEQEWFSGNDLWSTLTVHPTG